jgi:hypothetical protein
MTDFLKDIGLGFLITLGLFVLLVLLVIGGAILGQLLSPRAWQSEAKCLDSYVVCTRT